MDELGRRQQHEMDSKSGICKGRSSDADGDSNCGMGNRLRLDRYRSTPRNAGGLRATPRNLLLSLENDTHPTVIDSSRTEHADPLISVHG